MPTPNRFWIAVLNKGMVVEATDNSCCGELDQTFGKFDRLRICELVLVFFARPWKRLVAVDSVLWFILAFVEKLKDIKCAECGSP